MRLQEFLLARVAQDEAESGAVSVKFDQRRAVIYLHHERSMTVMSIGKFETITRCGVCTQDQARPCAALKALAQPNRHHPDYDTDWDLDPIAVSPDQS